MLSTAHQILATGGSEAEPGYAFSNDQNSGFWSVDDGVIGLSTNGFERLRVGPVTGVPNNNGVWITNGGSVSLVVGADAAGRQLTDETHKVGRVGVPHFTNAEEPFVWVRADSLLEDNILYLGGGTSLGNAATQVQVWTAADNITTTGTERWRFENNEFVGISGKTIRRGLANGEMYLSGDNSSQSGGNIVLYGQEHVSNANDIALRSGGAMRLLWDDSNAIWNYHGTGATNLNRIVRGDTSLSITISGGSTTSTGGNIALYGESHPTNSNDILLRAGGNTRLHWDASATRWDFNQTLVQGISRLHVGTTAPTGFYANRFSGGFTSSGGDTVLAGLALSHHLTAASGDTSWQAILASGAGVGASITTQNNGETITAVANMFLQGVTVNKGTDTIQDTATLYIASPTNGGINSHALYIDSGKLTANGGAKISVQNQVDGGSGQGIFLWDTDNSTYGIYLARSGAGKSLSDGTAPTSLDGRTDLHHRYRIAAGALTGFLWETNAEQCLMSLTANSGDLYTLGRIYMSVGSEGAPAITSRVSQNTGLWFPAAQEVALSTSGVQRWHQTNTMLTVSTDATFSGDVLLGATGNIYKSTTANELFVSGGSAVNVGGNIVLYGPSHATNANDIVFRTGTTTRLGWDARSSWWSFNGHNVVAAPNIFRGIGTASVGLSGGSAGNLGGNIIVYGESHATNANDMLFRAGTTPWLSWDNSTLMATFAGDVTITKAGSANLTLSNTASTVTMVIGAQTTAARVTAGPGDILGLGANNTADRVVIDTSGNTTFAGNVKVGSGNTVLSTDYSDLALGSLTGNHGLTIQSTLTGRGGIAFSDGNTASVASRVGRFDYNHATDTFEWLTNDGLRMSLSASAATFAGDVKLGSNGLIYRTAATGGTFISGGTTVANGGNIQLYGESHPTNANDISFRSSNTTRLQWQNSSGIWNFQGNTLNGVGDLTVNGKGTINAVSPTLTLLSTSINQAESGRIRFVETGTNGGFIHYNGLTNVFNIGVNDGTTSATDVNAILIDRASATVTVQTGFTVNSTVSLGAPLELTIASGAITVTKSFHTVDTEADAASDELDTINGGADGDYLELIAAHDARTVTLKDGTGNMRLAGDCALNTSDDVICLRFFGGVWREISRSTNS